MGSRSKQEMAQLMSHRETEMVGERCGSNSHSFLDSVGQHHGIAVFQ